MAGTIRFDGWGMLIHGISNQPQRCRKIAASTASLVSTVLTQDSSGRSVRTDELSLCYATEGINYEPWKQEEGRVPTTDSTQTPDQSGQCLGRRISAMRLLAGLIKGTRGAGQDFQISYNLLYDREVDARSQRGL